MNYSNKSVNLGPSGSILGKDGESTGYQLDAIGQVRDVYGNTTGFFVNQEGNLQSGLSDTYVSVTRYLRGPSVTNIQSVLTKKII